MKLWHYRRRSPAEAQPGWDHIVLELAVRVVQLLPEAGPERRAVHLVARVWRDAVRYCTTKLAPRSVDTGLMKEIFPHVTELVLEGLQLSPRDMLCLGGLGRLATLRLLSCTVEEGPSMLALATLSQLESLELRMMGGAGPEVVDDLLAKLTSLRTLELACWVPRNRAPKLAHLSSLGSLRQLTYSLPGMGFSVPGLAQLSGLGELKELSLEGASLTNSLLEGLSELHGLRRLRAPGAHALSDVGLEHLQELTDMRELDLSLPLNMWDDGSVTNVGVMALAEMQRLTQLNLAGRAAVGSGGLRWLETCGELRHLNLSLVQLGVNGSDHSFLWGLTQLTLLSVRGSRMEPEHFAGLAKLTQLQDIDVSRTCFSDECCQQLAPLRGLTRLELSNCPVTNKGLEAVPSGGPLQRLGIDCCPVSMLGVSAAMDKHRGAAMWQPSRDHMPRFVNVLHTLFIAQTSQGTFTLRSRVAPESSRSQSVVAWAAVGAFFMVYTMGLLGLLAGVVLLPLAAVGLLLVLGVSTLAGAKVSQKRIWRVGQQVEGVLLGLLVGLHGNVPHR